MTAFFSGLGLGFSLILAIGAQNAFVLKQGLKQQYVLLVVLICATSDAILITLGVAGFGLLIQQAPMLETLARYGGAAFLVWYGLNSLWSALTSNHTLQATGQQQSSAWQVVLTCLAFTWLNPHVYLDTVFLLGSVSTQYPDGKLAFGLGAVLASFLFFFTLGYGAALLRPLFNKPQAWKILEALIGLVMLSIAASLLWG